MKVDEWEDRERVAITWSLTMAVYHLHNADEIADNQLLIDGWFGKEMNATCDWLAIVHMALEWYGEQKGEVYPFPSHTHNYHWDNTLIDMWKPIKKDTA